MKRLTTNKEQRVYWIKNIDGLYQFHFKKPERYVKSSAGLFDTQHLLAYEMDFCIENTECSEFCFVPTFGYTCDNIEDFDDCVIFSFKEIDFTERFTINYKIWK